MMTAVGDSSRTAAMPGSSADADTRTAASNPVAPLDAAAATAACRPVSLSVDKPTGAAAYVRPSMSRTAAPLSASARAMAPRASATSLASSSSNHSLMPVVSRFRPVRFGGAQQNGVDPHSPSMIRAALGAQPQAMRDHLGPGQRHPAQFQGDQAAHGVDVEVIVEFNVVQFRDIFDRQACGNPKPLVTQVFYWGRLRLVVLVGDLSDDFF